MLISLPPTLFKPPVDQVKQIPNSRDLFPDLPQSKVFCPICVANGYASTTTATNKDWFFTANQVGGAIWNTSLPRLQLGLGLHSGDNAIRALVSFKAIPENKEGIGLNLGYGFQSQETGAAGFSSTAEWNPRWSQGSLNVFAGTSIQSNDGRVRPVVGFKVSPDQRWFLGTQYDGRANNPFIQRNFGDYSIGLIYIASRRLSATVGISF